MKQTTKQKLRLFFFSSITTFIFIYIVILVNYISYFKLFKSVWWSFGLLLYVIYCFLLFVAYLLITSFLIIAYYKK